MKIQTNAGEVELTAEMVCRGMVFAPKDPRDYCLGEGRVFVVGRRDDANGIWRDARNENLGTNVLGADRLLGCDPAYASRADCERFGVHGDAAAHGFARLRGGGAVDLRRVSLPVGAVVERAGIGRGSPVKEEGWFAAGPFVGLNASYARPEDVERLCCGATDPTAEPQRGQRKPFRWKVPRCTLAIGDHDEHEDLATGAKWPAKVRTRAFGWYSPNQARVRGTDVWRHADGRDVEVSSVTDSDRAPEGGWTDYESRGEVREWLRKGRGPEPLAGGVVPVGVNDSSREFGFRMSSISEIVKTLGDLEWSHGRLVPKVTPAIQTFPACAECGCEEGHLYTCPAVARARSQQATVEFGKGLGAPSLAFNLRATSLAPDGARNFTLKGTLTGGPLEQDRIQSIFRLATSQSEEVRLHHRGETIRALPLEGRTSLLLDGRGVEVSMLLREVRAQDKGETITASVSSDGFRFTAPVARFASWSPAMLRLNAEGKRVLTVYADGRLVCSCGAAPEHADDCDVPEMARQDAEAALWVLRNGGTIDDASGAVMARKARRKREAGLVALVNAVPEGLDPVGWRAAVLAYAEREDRREVATHDPRTTAVVIRRAIEGAAEAFSECAAAYRRAIAPHKAPPPERKTRGPRLTVDDGRDE